MIENENTLNIQFFYLKWKKKFAPMTGWREFNLLFSLLLGQRRHTTDTEIKIMWERKEAKKETLNIWKYIKGNKKCLTLVWTMLLIVTQLGCLTYIFRIHCYMEMTLNFSKVKLKKSYKSWPYFLFCFWLRSVAWGILASQPEAMPPAVEALSLNHWTTREVPPSLAFLLHSIPISTDWTPPHSRHLGGFSRVTKMGKSWPLPMPGGSMGQWL